MNEPEDATVLNRNRRGASHDLRGPSWRPLMVGAVFLAGLYLTFKVTAGLIYNVEGYEAGAADCDDCGVTLLLDNIGWLALAMGAYLLLACLALLALRRAGLKRRLA